MTRHPRWVHAAILAVVAGVALWLLRPSDPELPEYFQTPSFALTTQAGDTLRSDSLAGTVWIASFIYTSCPDICPVITARMAAVRDSFAEHGVLGDGVRLVSFTVDPERDTPPVLREYAGRFGDVDPARWAFLTGHPEEVRRLIQEGFFIGVTRAAGAGAVDTVRTGEHAEHGEGGRGDVVPDSIPAGLREGAEAELRARDTVGPPGTLPQPPVAGGAAGASDYLVAHSEYVLLVGKDGRVRGIYSGTDAAEMRQLQRDARRLAGS